MAYIPQPKDVTNFLGSNLTPQTYSSEAQFRSPSPPAAQNFMQPSPQMATGMGPSQTQIAPEAAPNSVAAGQAPPQTQPQIAGSPWQSSSGPSMGNAGGLDLSAILSALSGGMGKMGGGAGPMFNGGMDKLKSMWGGNGQPMLRGLFGAGG